MDVLIPRLVTLRRLVALGAAALVVSALADAAASAPSALPEASFTIDAGHVAAPARVSLAGTLTCSKYAHYHLNAWLEQRQRGALAKGSIPAKLGSRPSKLAIAHARAATACTGASQPWSLTLAAVGKHPAGFTAGPADACVVLYVGKSHLYTLEQSCRQVAIG